MWLKLYAILLKMIKWSRRLTFLRYLSVQYYVSCIDTHLQCMSLIFMGARYPSNFESDWFHTKFTQLKLCFSLFCHWFYNLHKEMDTYICKEFYCSDFDVRNSPICIIFDIRSVLKGTVHAMSMTHFTGIITNVLFNTHVLS